MERTAWLLIAASLGLSVTMVTAFSAVDTDARTVDVNVVDDASAYRALAENSEAAHKAYVDTSGDQVSITFDSPSGVDGSGVNVGSTYWHDAMLNVTNQGVEDKSIQVTITAADSSKCSAAWTDSTSQTDGDYASNPSTTLEEGTKHHLG